MRFLGTEFPNKSSSYDDAVEAPCVERGIREMYSIDSTENSEMAELARFLGFQRELDSDDATQVVHRLVLVPE